MLSHGSKNHGPTMPSKFASKSYFHNFRVNHTQDQSLSDNTHDFNDKIHVKPIDKKYTCNNRYLFVPI